MRRKDRELTERAALGIVDDAPYAVLATVNEDGSPYAVPISPVREGRALYFHCAKSGRKTDNLRRRPAVCVTCAADTKPLPERFTMAYRSAIVTGTAVEVTDEAEKRQALYWLCRRYADAAMDRFDEEADRGLARTAVWKISIDAVTGKGNIE